MTPDTIRHATHYTVGVVSLSPCPFCGGGETLIEENRMSRSPRMDGREDSIISVEIRHWCPAVEGQPNRNTVLRVGRDRASAVAAWNRRADDWQPIAAAPRDGTRVLMYAPAAGGVYPTSTHRIDKWRDGAWWEMQSDRPYAHWRPLPEGPTS